MMRLELFGGPVLSSFRRAAALTQAELVLASRGVLLPDCVEAIAADARKELPAPGHWEALMDAEKAALRSAFGSPGKAGDVVLGLVVGEEDLVAGAAAALVRAGSARTRASS